MRELKVGRYIVLVDEIDFEFVSRFDWIITKHTSGKIKDASTKVDGKFFKMHRLLLGVTDSSILVDHKNTNPLDNQRLNLRVATSTQNCGNRSISKSNTSGFKGVSFNKKQKAWRAYINCKGVKLALGSFSTKEEAALAYNREAYKVFGEFAKLNVVSTNNTREHEMCASEAKGKQTCG